jgi:ubiquitin C-terminal hydrolase
MNASLQCLLRVRSLTEYFLHNEHLPDLNAHNSLGSGGSVARAYCEFCRDMMDQNQSPFRAQQLHRTIGRHCETFNDSHAFLLSLLDVLDEDLNQSSRAKNDPIPRGLQGIEFHNFCHESSISKLFHGFTQTQIAFDCGHKEFVYDPFVFWTLPLPRNRQNVGK